MAGRPSAPGLVPGGDPAISCRLCSDPRVKPAGDEVKRTMPDLPRIAVIGTGGTISSLGNGSLDVLDYPDFGQKLTSDALLDKFPETRLVADPLPITVRQVGSTALGPAEWIEIRDLIHRLAAEDPKIAGFVIPHGT